MARLGAKGDVKSLRDHLAGVTDQAARAQGRALQRWSTETHVRAAEESVHVDLHDLPAALVQEVLAVVLREAPQLWTRKVRFLVGVDDKTLDQEEITPTLIRILKEWTLEEGQAWRISYRPGRPYVDIRRQEEEVQAAKPAAIPRRTSQPAATPQGASHNEDLSLIGRDSMGNLITATALLLAATPMLIAYVMLLELVLQAMGFVGAALLLSFVVGALVAELKLIRAILRPSHVNTCPSCGTLNRIVPILRRRPLQCGACEQPIYGAWPILPLHAHTCEACKKPVHIEAEVLTDSLPYCPHCEAPVTAVAKVRRK